ncbi:hypothetical protein BS47DRAFT_1397754 [Hydnum rufescens UP504]|uniref:Uncharacterized protein n=1 Tax=Hydnum rufescens UP504 TaxID=1448309 RepID=A0A9P6AMG0_9AGAM|nr:hypothetical protein BS47DRAFT_1397754 [Hydnum rufescens UP504]
MRTAYTATASDGKPDRKCLKWGMSHSSNIDLRGMNDSGQSRYQVWSPSVRPGHNFVKPRFIMPLVDSPVHPHTMDRLKVHATDDYFVHAVDPFSAPDGFFLSLLRAVLATALFRCWPVILFFTAWAAAICAIASKGRDVVIQPTLLTVLGTVLGFVISYRTSSSFERYNEGRRLWASVIFGSRTLSRYIWFHVPDRWADGPDHELNETEKKGRSLVEKKTVINLIEGFAVAVKHYLRGEDGIYYEGTFLFYSEDIFCGELRIQYVDLYHLVKYLPPYALPRGMPPPPSPRHSVSSDRERSVGDLESQSPNALSPNEARRRGPMLAPLRSEFSPKAAPKKAIINGGCGSAPLLAKRGVEVSGKARARARARKGITSHNIPLEITLYISSYISTLQSRKHLDVPTITNLLNAINIMGDALTGLERVLTTPIPFSLTVGLQIFRPFVVNYLPLLLRLAIPTVGPLKWVTIPATFVASFIYFGFLAAGEEIENPFGYDKVCSIGIPTTFLSPVIDGPEFQNDLNLDHFTQNIIRLELNSLTARAMPDIHNWAFSPANNHLFGSEFSDAAPEEWVRRGPDAIADILMKETGPMSASS